LSRYYLERVQQLTGPHFSAIVLDRSAVGHALADGSNFKGEINLENNMD